MSKCAKIMKRSQNGIIKTAVGSYLRRRNYIDVTERFKKSELNLSQSREEMVLSTAIDKDVSSLNSVTFNTVLSDAAEAEQQFSKLQGWVAEIDNEKIRNELSSLLFPIFCHLYLDFAESGTILTHYKSIRESLSLVIQEQKLLALADEMHSAATSQDSASFPNVKTFRSGKYECKITPKSLAAFKKYLVNSFSIFILQILKKWFELEVLMERGSSVPEPEEDGTIREVLPYPTFDVFDDVPEIPFVRSPAIPNQIRSMLGYTPSGKKMKLLLDSIRIVRHTPPIPNPYIIYRLSNFDNLCCANMHRSKKFLATGDLASEVRLWNLSETKLPPKRSICIPLGCDVETLVNVQQDNRFQILRGHSGPINDICFMPEADVILSASHDCTMRAWKMSDYSCASIYRGHNYPLWSVAVSPLGMHIATGSQDRTARLWNLDRTYPLRVYASHTADINCLSFHPNSCYIASGSVDKSVRLWSVTSGSLVRVFVGHTGSVQTLGFSPNGKFLASAGDGGRVKVWDLAGGGVLANLKGSGSRAIALEWSKCGSLVASASEDGKIQMWNVEKAIRMADEPSASETMCQYETNCSQLLSLQFSVRNTCVLIGNNTEGNNQPIGPEVINPAKLNLARRNQNPPANNPAGNNPANNPAGNNPANTPAGNNPANNNPAIKSSAGGSSA